VHREFFEQAVGCGLVAIGPGHEGAGLVGHQQAGHAADELQRVDDGATQSAAVWLAVAQA
jgi:hypothetical protein